MIAVVILALCIGASRADPPPFVATDMTPEAPLEFPEPGVIAPRFPSGVGNEYFFRVFFEDRNDGNRIKYVSWRADSTAFTSALGLTNISDTHFCAKRWPINVGGVEYAYRAWASVGDNPQHHFYVSNDRAEWTLVSTFTIPISSSHPDPHGQVYHGFHDVIELNGTYYAWGETNEGQTDLCRSANGDDVWEAIDVVGGVVTGPLLFSEPATPSGVFFELGGDRGYGKVHFRGNGSGVYLAINTAAKPSLGAAGLEAAFIDPRNWTWHDGTVGLPGSPVLAAPGGHDWREGWLVPGSIPSTRYAWQLIYDAESWSGMRGPALGWASVSSPPPGVGACCIDDGTCEHIDQTTCENDRGGQWLGTDTDCADGCPDCDCDGKSDWMEFWVCVQACTEGSGGQAACMAVCGVVPTQCRITSEPCDDDDPCTADECTGRGMSPVWTGCENVRLECSDGVECTVDVCAVEVSNVCERSGYGCDSDADCDGPAGMCSIVGNACDSAADCNDVIHESCEIGPAEACVEASFSTCIHETVDEACDDGDPCTIDTCTSADCLHRRGPDKDADGCCDLVDRCWSDPKHGCGPGPDYIPDEGNCIHVAFRAIIRSERSGLDTVPNAATLPEEDAVHLQNGCFVIEVWVQETIGWTSIACAFTDFHWEGDPTCLPKWTQIHWNDTLDQFRAGTIDNNTGTGINLGGCTLLHGVGVFPGWVRLATLHYDANHPACETEFHLTESEKGASVVGTEAFVLQFDSALLETECLGSLYDMAPGVGVRGSPDIGPEDFAFLAACWMVGGDGEELGDCQEMDRDCDGVVGPGEISFFATAWMKDVCDPGIVVPACQLHCDTDNARSMRSGSTSDGGDLPWADAEMIRSFDLAVPPDDWGGWGKEPRRGGALNHVSKTRREARRGGQR